MRRDIFHLEGFNEINVTPLLDLAWVLLVVFMVTITAAIQGITINLPKASNTPGLSKPKTKAISITADGQLYLDAYPVSMVQLESSLRELKAVDPNFPVVLRGDGQVYYNKVVAVLDLLGRLEITQLGLVTQNLVK